MLIVQKYGGTSVADAEKIFCAAGRIAQNRLKNNDMVVVLSAQGNMTDKLLEKASEICKDPPKRELDALLSTGEQQSAALMAMALYELGLPAVSLNARQAGIFSTPEHGQAKIMYINPERITDELKKHNIVIITGFQGIDENCDITTLGRGASDTTAVALASVLNADLCEIYTDVDGVFTADPRMVRDALKHGKISYDEMAELSSMGAKVMHNRSVELAKKTDVEFSVKSSFSSGEPTFVGGTRVLEGKSVSGITADRNICKITLTGLIPGSVPEILRLLASGGIAVDTVAFFQEDGIESIAFSVPEDKWRLAAEMLEERKDGLSTGRIRAETGLSKLSAVGAGVAYDAVIAALFYETLIEEGVKIHLLSLSVTKISALIEKNAVERAISALHAKFASARLLAPQAGNVLH